MTSHTGPKAQRPYQQCTRCIMDTTDPDIVFDDNGVCNHCHRHDMLMNERAIPEEKKAATLAELIANIKADGAGKPYDCVIGVSGGVDSTYVAWLTKEYGLRPLAVHLDNGWNSDLAVSNIEKTLEKLGIDLHTHVINWPEFRDLQISFLKACTPDGEVPTDHAIFALLLQMASKYGLRHILSGTNISTESILPESWGQGYIDWRYMNGVQKKFGTARLATYPHASLFSLAYHFYFRKIRLVSILNYVDYTKERAMDVLQNDLGWVYYGGKHYESIYTRFYQSWYLPKKFNIDKRKAHFSSLICSGQMTRDDALEAMKAPTYPEDLARKDYAYVIKKLGLSAEELDAIIASPNRTADDYPNTKKLFATAKTIINKRRQFIG